ncbi:DNA repair protein RecN [Pseudogracilibacillus sp. SO30301A]|uniref:DNA repair protein RecN n=1 Tax=Pseudogracilibacillus sp. SO30301A TaxID=3098291 RepID=UPI00300E10F7
MLAELSIRNFAIIDDISITFHDGLTVLTGETGAGKSIIIDAVQLLTGSRASVEFVRYGEEKAEITGLFMLNKNVAHIEDVCENYGIDIEENILVLDRTITNKGKSICRVNGKIVTLSILREIGQSLVNIHSQHDTIHLMDKSIHIELLDLYDEEKVLPIKKKYDKLYKQFILLQERHDELNSNEQQMAHRLDLLQFQLTELEQADLKENEDIDLMEERMQLQNYEKIYRSVHEAYHALSGEQKGLEWIDIAQNRLQEGKDFDPQIKKQAEDLTNAFYNLEEINISLRNFIDDLHFDEDRLNEIEMRLNEINRLKKKYGSSVKEMLIYQEQIKKELDELQNKDSHLERISNELKELKQSALKEANKLHALRKKIAISLEKDIKTELNDLYLQNATFKVFFDDVNEENLSVNGIDQLSFMLSTNLGEPLKELEKVASGGELSRIMLALKKIFAKHDNIDTVIFDEIDTGVSGRVAQAIAEKMYQISETTQVLCITHLPQVAAMSDHHILIQKEEKQNRTSTQMKELTDTEKIRELGSMMTGTQLTETAIEHSEELLDLTKKFKLMTKS